MDMTTLCKAEPLSKKNRKMMGYLKNFLILQKKRKENKSFSGSDSMDCDNFGECMEEDDKGKTVQILVIANASLTLFCFLLLFLYSCKNK